MSEDFGENERKGAQQILLLVDRFEEMIQNGKHYFYDSEEFEDIIDYYIDKNNPRNIIQSINNLGDFPKRIWK